MSTTYYDKSNGRWRVRWFITGGRASRSFASESAAREFEQSITNERTLAATGPKVLGAFTLEQVRARVDIDSNQCWIWRAKGGSHGYAQATRRVDGKVVTFLMHRVTYELAVGPIPAGLDIDHLCAETRCVNPDHLEPVTSAENNRRRDLRNGASA